MRSFFRGAALLTIALALLVGAWLPQRSAQAAEDVVRLTINNNSSRDVWLQLDGPAYYYLHVKAGESKRYTPKKGVYDYTLYHCGTSVSGQMDLTVQKTVDVPECGTKAYYGGEGPVNTLDAGRMLNLVDVTIKNQTNAFMLLILKGPSVYVFRFNSGESKKYTIPMGMYDYTMYGCGSTYTGRFYAHFHKVEEFTCPSW